MRPKGTALGFARIDATAALRRILSIRERRKTWRTYWLLQRAAEQYDRVMGGLDTAAKLAEREKQTIRRYAEERWNKCREAMGE